MISVVFEYAVEAAARAEFERVYGSDGDWARFFRTGDGYTLVFCEVKTRRAGSGAPWDSLAAWGAGARRARACRRPAA